MAVKKSQRKLCACSTFNLKHLKGIQRSKLGMREGYRLSIEGIEKG